jgi:hypothetical protein
VAAPLPPASRPGTMRGRAGGRRGGGAGLPGPAGAAMGPRRLVGRGAAPRVMPG